MKKKISAEDLDLTIEDTGSKKLSTRITETLTCPKTRNNCTDATINKPQLCDTTTTNPSQQNCISIEEDDCKPTVTCPLTIEPACVTNVECYDSKSNAQQCCAISEKDNTICENCLTVGTCGADSQCYCLVTEKNCPISGEDESCMCVLTDQETCEPPMPVTAVTDCTLCDN